MKIKTAELTGPALDWAVWRIDHADAQTDDELLVALSPFTPSTLWAQAGPIIEREKFCSPTWDVINNAWRCRHAHMPIAYFFGHTPLIAAMRCYVSSKLGDEVDVPEELA